MRAVTRAPSALRVALLHVVVVLASSCGGSPSSEVGQELNAGPSICDELGAVQTSSGVLRGGSAGGSCAFLGVPYAEPPVGALRFAPTLPVNTPGRQLAADRYGSPCAQLTPKGEVLGQEDCLTLNVWTPGGNRKPIIVFIHGGGNVSGGSAQPQYEGRYLSAAADVVVVTINYRLGPFGYFEHPQMPPGELFGARNVALSDQQAALSWVADNAAALGGDRDNVTVFGQSAGARAVCALLRSEAPAFDKAVVSSASCEFVSHSESEQLALEVSQALDCDDLECVRQVSAEELLRAVPSFPDMVSSSRYNLASNGVNDSRSDLPVLFGSNADEVLATIPELPSPGHYRSLLQAQVGAHDVDEVWARYFEGAQDLRVAFSNAFTDARYSCPIAEAVSDAQYGDGIQRTYRYLLDRPLDGAELSAFGSHHGLDLVYAFGTFEELGYAPSGADRDFSARMMQMLEAFAWEGAPQVPGVLWPTVYAGEPSPAPFTGDRLPLEGQQVMRLAKSPSLERGPRDQHCDFWLGRGQ